MINETLNDDDASHRDVADDYLSFSIEPAVSFSFLSRKMFVTPESESNRRGAACTTRRVISKR